MDKISLTLKLSPEEASALSLLCRQLDWPALNGYSPDHAERVNLRFALAALRFALSDAGYSANLLGEGE